MIYNGFIGGMNESRSKLVDLQSCVNWYPEIESPTSKSNSALIPTPGTKLFCTLSDSYPIRGMYFTSTGRMFAVSGTTLYEIFSTGIFLSRGTILTAIGQVYMSDNGIQLGIVDGSYGYILTLATNVLAQITDSDYPNNSSHIVCVNGRFIVNKKNTSQYNIYWSDSYNGLSWDGLAVASAEFFADRLIALQKTNNNIWLIGEQSSEVYYDSDDADQPFQRIQGSANNIGTVAPHSTATNGDSVFLIGSNAQGHGIVWMTSGLQLQRISTHAIEYTVQSFARIDDAIGYCYQQEGHSFYMLSFPTANRTLSYDVSTGQWHERTYYDETTNTTSRHLGNCHCFAFDKNYIGSYVDGIIYEFDLNTLTDNGATIRRIRTAPHLNNENITVFYNSLELDIEKGEGMPTQTLLFELEGDTLDQITNISLTNAIPGTTYYWELYRTLNGGLYTFKIYDDALKTTTLATGASASASATVSLGSTLTGTVTFNYTSGDNTVSDIENNKIICTERKPQIALSYSDDGGKTFKCERFAPLGAVGKNKTSVKWNRLGSSKDRVFRVVCSDPVKCTIVNAYINAEGGMA